MGGALIDGFSAGAVATLDRRVRRVFGTIDGIGILTESGADDIEVEDIGAFFVGVAFGEVGGRTVTFGLGFDAESFAVDQTFERSVVGWAS